MPGQGRQGAVHQLRREIVGTLRDKGFEVFLDLKFHDIPNTTAMAVKAAAEMGVWMVNVHCSGGLRMMLPAAKCWTSAAAPSRC